MNKLIVRIRYNSDSFTGYQIDSNGTEMSAFDSESLTEMPTLENIDETWLIVPGYDVLLTHLPAPQRLRRKQFSQSVPFILEEKLGEDIETLHFVTAQNRDKDKWPVAVVKKLLIDKWLELVTPLSARLTAIVPDYLLLPHLHDHWIIWFEEKHALVRMGECNGFCVESDMLFDVMHAYIADESTEKPSVIKFLNFKLPNKLDEIALAPHNITVQYDEISTEEDLTKAAFSIKNLPLNLLQGPYEVKRRNDKNILFSVLAGFLMTLLVGVFIGSNLIHYYSYKHQLVTINQKLENMKSDIYPAAVSTSELRQVMQNELTTLRKLQQQNQFLSLLLLTGEHLKNRDQIKIEGVEYRNQTLFVNLQLKSFETLDQLSKSLQGKGLVVKRESAHTEKDAVKARIIISRDSV